MRVPQDGERRLFCEAIQRSTLASSTSSGSAPSSGDAVEPLRDELRPERLLPRALQSSLIFSAADLSAVTPGPGSP